MFKKICAAFENIICKNTTESISSRPLKACESTYYIAPFLALLPDVDLFIFPPPRIDICVHNESNSYKLRIEQIKELKVGKFVLRIMTITF